MAGRAPRPRGRGPPPPQRGRVSPKRDAAPPAAPPSRPGGAGSGGNWCHTDMTVRRVESQVWYGRASGGVWGGCGRGGLFSGLRDGMSSAFFLPHASTVSGAG